jgi:predicted nucleotidyltransferase
VKTVGIIVEYNPLHYGHVYHFEQSKKAAEADAVIAVMSGNFLQRGEPAIVNKWTRAEMALRMGADLVIELPVAFSSQPAEWFAYGAVSALDRTGVVDSLCFGSESGQLDWLHTLATHLYREPESFKRAVKAHLKKGVNYPAAYSAAIAEYAREQQLAWPAAEGTAADSSSILAAPNNILGLHYLIALHRLQSGIRPLTIARTKAGYHQTTITDRQIASATAIRRILIERGSLSEAQAYMPAYTYHLLQREWEAGRAPIRWDNFGTALTHQLITKSAEELHEIYEVSEGLEHRLKRVISLLPHGAAFRFEHMLDLLKTRRYTTTKLQRTLLRILLNHSKRHLELDTLRKGTPYLRILGFSDTGRQLLKKMKTTATVPVITKITKESPPLLELDITASSVYSLAYRNASRDDMLRDYYSSPVQL